MIVDQFVLYKLHKIYAKNNNNPNPTPNPNLNCLLMS